MSGKTIIIGAIVCALILCSTCVMGLILYQPPKFDPTPKIAGQKVPDTIRKINFEKRYDFHSNITGPNQTVFRNCKIIGFTGDWSEEKGGGSFGSGGGYRFFEGYLVLELSDGRLAYIPPRLIEFFEEAAPKP
jgi:hypothetical protein